MKQRFTIIIEDGISNKHMRAAMAKAAECILDKDEIDSFNILTDADGNEVGNIEWDGPEE